MAEMLNGGPTPAMKISIAFGSRAHAYALAQNLNRRSMLQRAYTYYPLASLDLDMKARCRSFPYFFLALTAMSRLKMGKISGRLGQAANDAFSRWVAKSMEPADVFMTMSGLGLHSRRAAKAMGALTVCDRGSTHIRYQDELLADEAARVGIAYRRIPKHHITNEETEYAEADLIVAQSTFAKQSFLEQGVPASKVAWLSPGVDTGTFFPGPKRDGVFRVLYVGQIGYRKGIQYLLEASSRFRANNTEVVIAGRMLPEGEQLLRRYEGVFRYAGSPRTTGELRDLYCQSSVMILPSIEDGFGLVLQEAMACGIPVIATTNTGGPDLVDGERQGLIVPIRSPEAIAEAVVRLRRDPDLLREMGLQALHSAQASTWDAYATRVLALYGNYRATLPNPN